MSFSSDVKHELSQIELTSDCCLQAQAYGMLLFGRAFSYSDISFTTENEAVAQKYSDIIYELFSFRPNISTNNTKKYTVEIKNKADRTAVMELFGHDPSQVTLRINRANITSECCFGAFLRGVFLACGTVTDPEKNYHLEFTISRKKICMDLIQLLEEVGFEPKYVYRKYNHVIYFKISEAIEDFLTLIGATNSTLTLMGVKMQKDIVNRVNRRVNFESANLSRTVDAALEQVYAIEKIERTRGLETLPKQLQEMARLRRENPEESLSELAGLINPPISRSGVNHRLKRLVEIANEIPDGE